jgi:DNA-binding PadR family transcriptional regulator
MSALAPDETILGLLASKPQHGYQFLETFNRPDNLGNVWDLSTSQLYAVLKRLERQGWITGRQMESEIAPPRTEYALTKQGADHLNTWLNEDNPSSSIRRVRVEFLSRLYVAQLLELPVQPIIARQRAACQSEHARKLALQENNVAGVGWLASELVIAQLDAVLQWIDRCKLVLIPSQT